jgi:tetratricopeptide (TPR) repeat protein
MLCHEGSFVMFLQGYSLTSISVSNQRPWLGSGGALNRQNNIREQMAAHPHLGQDQIHFSGTSTPNYNTMIVLGQNHYEAGQYQQAYEVFSRALDCLSPGDSNRNRLNVITLMAKSAQKLGQTDKALKLMENAVQLVEDELPCFERVAAHKALAGLYQEKGRFEAAEAHYRESLETLHDLREMNVLKEPFRMANCLIGTANIALDMAEIRQKEERHEDAIAVVQSAYEDLVKYPLNKTHLGAKTNLLVAMNLKLAESYGALDQLDSAIQSLDEAEDLIGEATAQNAAILAKVLDAKVQLYESQSEFEIAKRLEDRVETLIQDFNLQGNTDGDSEGDAGFLA